MPLGRHVAQHFVARSLPAAVAIRAPAAGLGAHGHNLGGLAGHVVLVDIGVGLGRGPLPGLGQHGGGGLPEFGHGLAFLGQLTGNFVLDQGEGGAQAVAGQPLGGVGLVEQRREPGLGAFGKIEAPAQGGNFRRGQADRGIGGQGGDLALDGRPHGRGLALGQGVHERLGLVPGKAQLAQKPQQLGLVVAGNLLVRIGLGGAHLLVDRRHQLAPGHAAIAHGAGLHVGDLGVGESPGLEFVAQAGNIFLGQLELLELIGARSVGRVQRIE